jgi:hypothetical protein
VRIKESAGAVNLSDAIPTELRSNQMGLARDNRPHAIVDLLSLDLLSKTVILPVECSFIETCQIKDCIPHGLAWNRATVDGHATNHPGPFDHSDTFS